MRTTNTSRPLSASASSSASATSGGCRSRTTETTAFRLGPPPGPSIAPARRKAGASLASPPDSKALEPSASSSARRLPVSGQQAAALLPRSTMPASTCGMSRSPTSARRKASSCAKAASPASAPAPAQQTKSSGRWCTGRTSRKTCGSVWQPATHGGWPGRQPGSPDGAAALSVQARIRSFPEFASSSASPVSSAGGFSDFCLAAPLLWQWPTPARASTARKQQLPIMKVKSNAPPAAVLPSPEGPPSRGGGCRGA
mmetsp:Transcript_1160/g.3586  ORF Transcript_1160/g.3586 Transcript_1160/m.3586 type:complete len:256 (+) Transcript_1160:956-1723(+)